jgi:hypothetical protein
VDDEKPAILSGSPSFQEASQLKFVGMSKRDPETVKRKSATAEQRLHTACAFYSKRYDQGRLFLHEHPWGADSWQDEEVLEIECRLGV